MKKERINPNTASPGDKISYFFYEMESEGVVRKVLENSVIVSLSIDPIYKNTAHYEKVYHQVGIPEETVVNYKHYTHLKEEETLYYENESDELWLFDIGH